MKKDKQRDQHVLVDMNVSLIAYSERRMAGQRNVLNSVIKTIDRGGIDNLTSLLNDGGAAAEDYRAIASGYLRNAYDLRGVSLEHEIKNFVDAAVKYLHAHTREFANI